MIDVLQRTLAGARAWLVGGAVRDRRLGRATGDLDVALDGDPERAALALRATAGGAAFPLSETFGGWRVVGRDQAWRVDLLPLVGGSLEADLAARDFTVNAMAEPLDGGPLVDPYGGIEDLERRCMRMVSPTAFDADPLRVMRLVRLGLELGLEAEPGTLAAARRAAAGLERVAGERIFAELKRIVTAERPAEGMRRLESTGATAIVLPELVALKGVEQNVYHHADVHDHTLDVLEAVAGLERDEPDPRVRGVLGETLGDELTRWQSMRLAALLHDVAKPITAGPRADGRGTSFVGHDVAGASVAHEILRRLRASERLADHVAAITRDHLRLGFLVGERPLARRSVHRYLQATAPWSVDVTMFTCADRLATRGRGSEAAIPAHLALAREMLEHAFEARPYAPLVRGDELARELGIAPGPKLGELLARLEEDRFAGEITTRDDAIARARSYLG